MLRTFDFVNPFDPDSIAQWFYDRLSDAAQTLVEWVQQLLAFPPNLLTSDWAAYLFGNVIGVLPALVYFTTFFGTVAAMFFQKRIKNWLQIMAIAVFVGFGTRLWFQTSSQLYDWGTTLTQAAHFYQPGQDSSNWVSLNPLSSIFISIAGTAAIMSCALMLWLILLLYTGLNVSINFWFLPALTLYGLSDGWKKFVKLMISVMLVTMVSGRASMAFIVDVFRSLAGSIQTGVIELQTAMTYGLVTVGMLFAIAFQIVLVWLTYKTVNAVEGKIISGFTQVSGKVDIRSEETLRTSEQQANSQHVQSMRPPAVRIYEHRMTDQERTKLAAKQAAVSAGAKVVKAGLVAGAGYVGISPTVSAPVISTVTSKAEAEVHDRVKRRAKGQSMERKFGPRAPGEG